MEKNRYELARMHAVVITKPHLAKGTQLRIHDFWPLPWDNRKQLQRDAKAHSNQENSKVLSLAKAWKEKGLIKLKEEDGE